MPGTQHPTAPPAVRTPSPAARSGRILTDLTVATWARASVPLFAAGVLRHAARVRRRAAGCPESVVLA